MRHYVVLLVMEPKAALVTCAFKVKIYVHVIMYVAYAVPFKIMNENTHKCVRWYLGWCLSYGLYT